MWYPLLRLREEGHDTFTIGPEEGKVYQSKKGYPCKADACIDNVKAEVSLQLSVQRKWGVGVAITI